MAKNKSAWGIEIGAHAIKAIRLERKGDEAVITDFACIPHNKPLTTPDLDVAEMTRLTMGQLVASKNIEDQKVVISVPGHSALARFAKLPPVEPKMIPNIVKFEAVQQIPFPIEEVEWDYQTFASPDNPEVEVGIFAITKERIEERLKLYAEYGIRPEIVTLGPLAVFNAVSFDLSLADDHKPVVILDIGTQASDVIFADHSRCWIRTFPLGGTHFTEALKDAFQITYSKADRLKADSATSTHARQMMQAMRPVFGDLVQEVQRSIGHYQMNHQENPLATVLAVGSTFRIPGLRKFLGQQLNVDINRMDEFKRIRVEGREAADFAANSINFVTAYGLALQGIGLSRISVNLAPVRGLREKVWAAKSRWFIAAASIAVIGSAAMYAAPILNQQYLETLDTSTVSKALTTGASLQTQLKEADSAGEAGATASNMDHLLSEDRKIWPCIVKDAVDATLSANPTVEITATDSKIIEAIPAKERKRIVLESLSGVYAFDDATKKRTIVVSMNIEFANEGKKTFLVGSILKWLEDHSNPRDNVPYIIVPKSMALKADAKGEELQTTEIPGGEKKSDSKNAKPTDAVADAVDSRDQDSSSPPPSSGSSSNAGATGSSSSGSSGSRGGRRDRSSGGGGVEKEKPPESSGQSAPSAAAPEANQVDNSQELPANSEKSESSNGDLESLAPITEGALYGPGMKVHKGTIVFTIEIIDGAAKKSEAPASP